MKKRILHILIAFDQFVFCIMTLGWSHPDETISSALWRYQNKSWFAYYGRIFVDWLFSPFEDDHCFRAYLSEINRQQTFK